jgi:CRP-like cAMP-binding protein
MNAKNTYNLDKSKDYLQQVSLFKGLNDNQLESLIKCMSVIEIKAGDFVMHEGETGTEIYILLTGEVEISKSLVLPQWIQSAQSQEKSLIRLSEKQSPFFGEMSMFGQESTREASIKAIKACRIACLSKDSLLKEINKDSQIGSIIYFNIASELVKRLRKANKDILKLTTAFSLALEG